MSLHVPRPIDQSLHPLVTEAHGGVIECENREPQGARFTITLPVSAPPKLFEEPAA
ncbi:hypothetical protein [Paraburkholderia sp. BR14374]|uniref:hypothetical protein n=1 Tax=Paraburkholderia sp. BR14374 TaxID=3237007 RepID=UPI0034CE76FA